MSTLPNLSYFKMDNPQIEIRKIIVDLQSKIDLSFAKSKSSKYDILDTSEWFDDIQKDVSKLICFMESEGMIMFGMVEGGLKRKEYEKTKAYISNIEIRKQAPQ